VLRATPAWKTIPIMILTGVLQDEGHRQAATLGVERFLRKPRGLQEYRALVEDITAWWQIRAYVPTVRGTHRQSTPSPVSAPR
jgi:CheY-like chemotaxis protein